MTTLDLTLRNPLIEGFFKGTSNYVPSGEFVYIHTHLVSENFLSEIETLIRMACEQLIIIKDTDPAAFQAHATKLESLFPGINLLFSLSSSNIDEKNAKRMLFILKDAYQFTMEVLGDKV